MSEHEMWCLIKFYDVEDSDRVPYKLGKIICKCIEKSDIGRYSMEINHKDLIMIDKPKPNH